MIHKNWQELIKPMQLDVKPGNLTLGASAVLDMGRGPELRRPT